MTNNDALERLRNRTRPKVPARDASVANKSPDTSTSRNLDLEFPADVVFQAERAATQQPQPSRSRGTLKPRTPDTSTSAAPNLEVPEPPPLETKQSTMRLEKTLSERLQQLSRSHGVCREAVIEAMFEFIEANPEAKDEVLDVAQEKNEQRQAIANYKRAQSMMKRFLQKE